MVNTRSKARAEALARPPPIAVLSDELILTVFDLLHNFDRAALFAATKVCKAWHALAQRIIDARIGPLVLSPKAAVDNLKLFARLKSDRGYRQRVHHLSIRDWYLEDMTLTGYGKRDCDPFHQGEYFSGTWTETERRADSTWPQVQALVEVLPTIPLRSFSWSAAPSIPEELAMALGTMPTCAVRSERNANTDELVTFALCPYVNYQSMVSLSMVSQQLSSLHLLVPAANDALLAKLPDLIWTSPFLRDLQLHATGLMWMKSHVPHALKGTKLDMFIILDNLGWLRRPAQVALGRRLRFSRLELRNVCICDTDDSAVLDAVDWSCLEHLSLTCVGLLQEVCTRSTGVRRLEMLLSSGRDCEYGMCSTKLPLQAVKQILLSSKSLQHLELINGTCIVDDELLRSIGLGLESFVLHERPGIRRPLSRIAPPPILSTSLLSLMRALCPRLTTLEVDVPYADDEYGRYLGHISIAMPHLKSLRAFREIEISNDDDSAAVRSQTTLASVGRNFQGLRAKMHSLERFESFVTSLPPLYADRKLHEYANNVRKYERRFVAEFTSESSQPRMYCYDLERAKMKAAEEAPGTLGRHWDVRLEHISKVLGTSRDLSRQPDQPF